MRFVQYPGRGGGLDPGCSEATLLMLPGQGQGSWNDLVEAIPPQWLDRYRPVHTRKWQGVRTHLSEALLPKSSTLFTDDKSNISSSSLTRFRNVLAYACSFVQGDNPARNSSSSWYSRVRASCARRRSRQAMMIVTPASGLNSYSSRIPWLRAASELSTLKNGRASEGCREES